MTLLGIDKVLHLYEYENLPQELVYQKNDDELSSGTLIPAPVTYGQRQIALPIPNLIERGNRKIRYKERRRHIHVCTFGYV